MNTFRIILSVPFILFFELLEVLLTLVSFTVWFIYIKSIRLLVKDFNCKLFLTFRKTMFDPIDRFKGYFHNKMFKVVEDKRNEPKEVTPIEW